MENNLLPQKHWYIVTTYSTDEEKVAENIRKRVESYNIQDKVFRVLVATEEIPVTRKGEQVYVEEDGVKVAKTKKRNLFPTYIFIEMIMTDDTWFIVRNTEGVTGIVGSAGGGQKPLPVSSSEMEAVLKIMNIVEEDMYDKYKVGDLVKVINGTFKGSDGNIISIDQVNKTVSIEITFLGRKTPVELDFKDVVKA